MVSNARPSIGVLVEVGTGSGPLGTDRAMLALAAQEVLPHAVYLVASSAPARRAADALSKRWQGWFAHLEVLDTPDQPGGLDAFSWLATADVPYPFWVRELQEALRQPSVVATVTGCLAADYDEAGILRRREALGWPPPSPAELGSYPTESWRWAARRAWLEGRAWTAVTTDLVDLAQRAPGALRLSHRSSAERRRIGAG